MPNPLKAAYKNGGTAPSAAPATTPASAAPSPAVAAPPAASTAAPVASASAGTTPARDLSALRAKLAGGFVNPPETGEAVNEDTLAPRTVETPDGGAQAAPGWVEAKNGLVVRAPADTAEPVPSASTSASTAELSRGQKAAATRAANKAKASSAPSGVAPVAAVESSGTANDEAPSVAFTLKDISTDDLLAEIYKRVAVRFA